MLPCLRWLHVLSDTRSLSRTPFDSTILTFRSTLKRSNDSASDPLSFSSQPVKDCVWKLCVPRIEIPNELHLLQARWYMHALVDEEWLWLSFGWGELAKITFSCFGSKLVEMIVKVVFETTPIKESDLGLTRLYVYALVVEERFWHFAWFMRVPFVTIFV